jgi:large subunit ribosomal protein L6
MSRIGRLPIAIDSSVQVTIEAARVIVKGPKGQIDQPLPSGIRAEMKDKDLRVERQNDSKRMKSLHGLIRALLANAVQGVSKGFNKDLEIHGVGYRADLSGKLLKLSLGYSHPVEYQIPDGVQIGVEDRNTRIKINGFDRQQVGQVAADIRSLRPPDAYKLKGIRYAGEQLRKKAGKTGAK